MTEKILSVRTDYFQAEAVWRKIYGIWSCTAASPQLRWMIGMNPGQAKIALLRMDAQFTFSQQILATGTRTDPIVKPCRVQSVALGPTPNAPCTTA